MFKPNIALVCAALLLGISVAQLSSTGSAEDALDCGNLKTQTEMTACASREWQRADNELNAVYMDLRQKLQSADQARPANTRPVEPSLVNGQRGWVAYRDGHCDVATLAMRGGSMEPTIRATCAATLTERRTEEIRALIKELNK